MTTEGKASGTPPEGQKGMVVSLLVTAKKDSGSNPDISTRQWCKGLGRPSKDDISARGCLQHSALVIYWKSDQARRPLGTVMQGSSPCLPTS